MGEQLKPYTSEKMRALCKKISVAHNLDAEIQEELYAHMEDKLLAYLNGEETLAEEDALILVREHFGDPSQVKALFQEVHSHETNVSLFRRLAAAMIVTAGVEIICLSLGIAVRRLWPTTWNMGVLMALLAVGSVLTVIFSWLLLWRYQRRLDAGHTPWFLTWHPAYLAGSITALLAIQSLVRISLNLFNTTPVSGSGSMWPQGLLMLIMISITASPVFICMTWLWWCDRPPRQARAMGTAAGWWVIWMFFSSTVANIDHLTKLESSSSATQLISSSATKVVFSLSSTAQLHGIATSIAFSFAFLVGYALVACALYKAGQYAAHYNFKEKLQKNQ